MKKIESKRVGLLCPNTPAFLESVFGIGAAGAVNVGESYSIFPSEHFDVSEEGRS